MTKPKIDNSAWMKAFAGGILGTVSTILKWNQRKNRIGKSSERAFLNHQMMLGGLAGGLIGAAAALLFAPASGARLRQEVVRPFSRFLKNDHETAPNSPPKKKRPAQQAKKNNAGQKKKAPSDLTKKSARTAKSVEK